MAPLQYDLRSGMTKAWPALPANNVFLCNLV